MLSYLGERPRMQYAQFAHIENHLDDGIELLMGHDQATVCLSFGEVIAFAENGHEQQLVQAARGGMQFTHECLLSHGSHG
ncbi:hypothetical protein CS053_08610 [Rhodanobacter glycinis]|uniref:Uncharacterized protein n=1 Tax=Rhodanobacter glycinis TaxID=582702 RepID=A0A5B9DYA0_9GAMM|nr:hypothetical protein [Rhodanobacter glycinis]QEE24558.1 hypothetical protein CS053_08610 [Rhodanobacter glycinis]